MWCGICPLSDDVSHVLERCAALAGVCVSSVTALFQFHQLLQPTLGTSMDTSSPSFYKHAESVFVFIFFTFPLLLPGSPTCKKRKRCTHERNHTLIHAALLLTNTLSISPSPPLLRLSTSPFLTPPEGANLPPLCA